MNPNVFNPTYPLPPQQVAQNQQVQSMQTTMEKQPQAPQQVPHQQVPVPVQYTQPQQGQVYPHLQQQQMGLLQQPHQQPNWNLPPPMQETLPQASDQPQPRRCRIRACLRKMKGKKLMIKLLFVVWALHFIFVPLWAPILPIILTMICGVVGVKKLFRGRLSQLNYDAEKLAFFRKLSIFGVVAVGLISMNALTLPLPWCVWALAPWGGVLLYKSFKLFKPKFHSRFGCHLTVYLVLACISFFTLTFTTATVGRAIARHHWKHHDRHGHNGHRGMPRDEYYACKYIDDQGKVHDILHTTPLEEPEAMDAAPMRKMSHHRGQTLYCQKDRPHYDEDRMSATSAHENPHHREGKEGKHEQHDRSDRRHKHRHGKHGKHGKSGRHHRHHDERHNKQRRHHRHHGHHHYIGFGLHGFPVFAIFFGIWGLFVIIHKKRHDKYWARQQQLHQQDEPQTEQVADVAPEQ